MNQAMHDRRSRLVPALAAVVVALGWAAAGSAGAAVTGFALEPTSGPPGTVVVVSGAGCSPGLTVSAANDYVLVTAPTLQISTHATVAANGSWHGSFTVPAGALPAGAPVAALCVSDGLPSLLTLYSPQTFTVTAPATTTASTTTTTTTGTTNPTTPTTPTTKPRESGGTVPTTPPTNGGTQPPHGGEGPGTTLPISGGTSPGGGGAGSNGGSAHRGSVPAGSGAGKVDVAHATSAAARAADLSAPELPAADVGGSGGLGWLAWLLLLALVGAAVATPLWIRRSRRIVAEGGDLGDAA